MMKYFAVCFALCLSSVVAPPPPQADAMGMAGMGPQGPSSLTFSSVATGFCSPRGLELYNGFLYVSESGVGAGNNADLPCFGGSEGSEGGESCMGPTGRVSRIKLSNNQKETVAEGFFSFSNKVDESGNISGAVGPVATLHNNKGDLLILVSMSGEPEAVEATALPFATQGGKILKKTKRGLEILADVRGFEAANDPDGAGPDSDPYDFLFDPTNPQRILVADAAANAVFGVEGSTVQTYRANFGSVARSCIPRGQGPCTPIPPELPPFVGPPFCCGFNPESSTYPSQVVPTSLAVRPGSNEIYMGELTGAMWNDDKASIVRVDTAQPEVLVSGFNAIISIAFDGPNRLYVLEQNFFGLGTFEGSNRLSRVDLPSKTVTVVSTNLQYATHIFVNNGVLYASDNALIQNAGACQGSVVKANLN